MKPNILWSYAYARGTVGVLDDILHVWRDLGAPVLLDSGAFTAWTLGRPINLDDYIDYLRTRAPLFTGGYIALDVVGNHAATLVNLRRMVEAGLRPMPVVTDDMSVQQAQEVCGIASATHACIAGGTIWPDAEIAARYKHMASALPGVRLHGLGYTRKNYPWRVPLYSVDSSSWNVGVRYGLLQTFNLRDGIGMDHWGQLQAKPFAEWPSLVHEALRECNVSPDQFDEATINSGTHSWVSMQGIHSWMKYAGAAQHYGRRFYFATGNLHHILSIAAVADCALQHGCMRYPDNVRIFRSHYELFKRDVNSYYRYITRRIDWSKLNDIYLPQDPRPQPGQASLA